MRTSLVAIISCLIAPFAQAEDNSPVGPIDAPKTVEYVARSHNASNWLHLATNMSHSQADGALEAVNSTLVARCGVRGPAEGSCSAAVLFAYASQLVVYADVREVRVRPLDAERLSYTIHYQVDVTAIETRLCEFTKSELWCAPSPRPPEQ